MTDRGSGECTVTSSWESEAARHAGDAQLRLLRERGRDLFGGSMQVVEWEIAVLHRSQHGECCRASWLQGDPDAMVTSLCEEVLPRLKQVPGFRSASLLLNPSTGQACLTTARESRAAMKDSGETADDMRSDLAAGAGGETVEVHEYELVHAHLARSAA